mmetsp:Transcript_11126/g.19612  ORF Transcript_11126/g.19612 Transcript_11126/m.19612 type:complete len:97 (-) Transcript_11126:289-579(-)
MPCNLPGTRKRNHLSKSRDLLFLRSILYTETTVVERCRGIEQYENPYLLNQLIEDGCDGNRILVTWSSFAFLDDEKFYSSDDPNSLDFAFFPLKTL